MDASAEDKFSTETQRNFTIYANVGQVTTELLLNSL